MNVKAKIKVRGQGQVQVQIGTGEVEVEVEGKVEDEDEDKSVDSAGKFQESQSGHREAVMIYTHMRVHTHRFVSAREGDDDTTLGVRILDSDFHIHH